MPPPVSLPNYAGGSSKLANPESSDGHVGGVLGCTGRASHGCKARVLCRAEQRARHAYTAKARCGYTSSRLRPFVRIPTEPTIGTLVPSTTLRMVVFNEDQCVEMSR